MLVKWTRLLLVVATLLAVSAEIVSTGRALAQDPHVRPRYDLFYNYYVDGDSGVPAQMYPAPRPTPPFVGHTYFTYQPFLPHEFMYPHSRVYRRYRPGGVIPQNTTRVSYW